MSARISRGCYEETAVVEFTCRLDLCVVSCPTSSSVNRRWTRSRRADRGQSSTNHTCPPSGATSCPGHSHQQHASLLSVLSYFARSIVMSMCLFVCLFVYHSAHTANFHQLFSLLGKLAGRAIYFTLCNFDFFYLFLSFLMISRRQII